MENEGPLKSRKFGLCRSNAWKIRIGYKDPLWKLDPKLRDPQPYQRVLGSKLKIEAEGPQTSASQQWVSYK